MKSPKIKSKGAARAFQPITERDLLVNHLWAFGIADIRLAGMSLVGVVLSYFKHVCFAISDYVKVS